MYVSSGKSSAEEDSSEHTKKKLKVDNLSSSSKSPGPRLSDQTINDYLDIRKNTSAMYNNSFIFSTFYYEQFTDGGRSAKWSLPYLFDFKHLVLPIFQRKK